MEKKYGDLSNLKFISRLNKRCILNEGRLEEYERELGIKFPESDREYIKSFMGTHPYDLYIDIKLENGEIIECRISNFATLGRFYKDKLIQDISEKQKEYLKENEKEFVNLLENIKNILSDEKIILIGLVDESFFCFSDYGYLTSFNYEELMKSDIDRMRYNYMVGKIGYFSLGVIGYDYRDSNCKVVYIGEEGVIELGKSIVELKDMIYTSSEKKDNEKKEDYINTKMKHKLSDMGYLYKDNEISLEELYYDYEDTPEEIEEAEKKLGIKFPKKFKELRALGLKRIVEYERSSYEDGYPEERVKELSVKEMIKEHKNLYNTIDEFVETMIEETGEAPEQILPPKLIPLYEIMYDVFYDYYYKFECLYYHDGVPEDEPEVVKIEGYDVNEAFLTAGLNVEALKMIKLGSTYEEYINSDYLLKPNLDLEEVKKEARIYGENVYRINIGENLRRYKVEKKEEYKRREKKDISIELLSEREKIKGEEFCKIVNNGIMIDFIKDKFLPYMKEETTIEDIGKIEVYELSQLLKYEGIKYDKYITGKELLRVCNRLSEKYGYEPVYMLEDEKIKIKELSKDEGVEIEKADYRDTEGFRIAPIYYQVSGEQISRAGQLDLIEKVLQKIDECNLEVEYSLKVDILYICRTVSEDE